MGLIASTSIRSIPAVDASPSGPKNGCLAVPGPTPFAGRLRPVGAVGFGISEDLPRINCHVVGTIQLNCRHASIACIAVRASRLFYNG